MSTIREKYGANIVLNHNYRKGSILDQSGLGNDGTANGTVKWTRGEKGRALYFYTNSDGYVSVPDSANLRFSSGTLIVFGNLDLQVSTERFIAKRFGGPGCNYDFYSQPTLMGFYDGATTSSIAVNIKGSVMVGVTFTSGQAPNFFKDGVFVGAGNNAVTIDTAVTPILTIGSYYNFTNTINRNPFYEAIIFNTVLTKQEISQFYEEWLQEGNYDSVDIGHLDNRYDAFDATGADSLSTYLAQGRGWNSTLANVTGGSLENTGWRVLTGTWSVTDSLQKTNGAQILADANMEASGTANWTAYFGSPTISKNTTNPHSGTQCLRMTITTVENPIVYQASTLTIGKNYRVRGWARGDGVRTPSVWISNGTSYDWLGSASTTWQFFDVAFKDVNLTEIRFMCHGAAGSSGWCEFDDLELYEVLPEGHKIQNVAVGAVVKPCDIAYGTWEFEVNKGGTGANSQNIMLTASKPAIQTDAAQNGYMMTVEATEQFVAYRITAGAFITKFTTLNDVIPPTGWTSFKVTRSAAGVWTFYTKISGVWALLTANTGTNPFTDNTYTTSMFTVLDLDAGDFIRNFTFKPYII